jgi:hypothetical protein
MIQKKTILISEDKLAASYLEACSILSKMRRYRRRFEQNHDAQTKSQMKSWEARADKFLDELALEDENNSIT